MCICIPASEAVGIKYRPYSLAAQRLLPRRGLVIDSPLAQYQLTPKQGGFMGSDKRKRDQSIQIRVTAEEKRFIEQRANACAGGTSAHYLRSLGLGTELKTKSDGETVKTLLKIGADFGRVGGLVKLFVAQREHRYSVHDFQTMDRFIKELDMTRTDIAEALKKLIR